VTGVIAIVPVTGRHHGGRTGAPRPGTLRGWELGVSGSDSVADGDGHRGRRPTTAAGTRTVVPLGVRRRAVGARLMNLNDLAEQSSRRRRQELRHNGRGGTAAIVGRDDGRVKPPLARRLVRHAAGSRQVPPAACPTSDSTRSSKTQRGPNTPAQSAAAAPQHHRRHPRGRAKDG